MKSYFRPPESFALHSHDALLQQNYRFMRSLFQESLIEFYFYLKPSDTRRFFIILVEPVEEKLFGKTMVQFAENMNFEMLSNYEASRVIRSTTPLNEYT